MNLREEIIFRVSNLPDEQLLYLASILDEGENNYQENPESFRLNSEKSYEWFDEEENEFDEGSESQYLATDFRKKVSNLFKGKSKKETPQNINVSPPRNSRDAELYYPPRYPSGLTGAYNPNILYNQEVDIEELPDVYRKPEIPLTKPQIPKNRIPENPKPLFIFEDE